MSINKRGKKTGNTPKGAAGNTESEDSTFLNRRKLLQGLVNFGPLPKGVGQMGVEAIKRLIARPIATLSIQAQEQHEQEEKIYVDN